MQDARTIWFRQLIVFTPDTRVKSDIKMFNYIVNYMPKLGPEAHVLLFCL